MHTGPVVIADGGDFLSFARVGLSAGTYLDPGSLGCLGVGVPFGIAACLAQPERQVVVATGDGSFGFNAIEVDTAVRHRVPLLIVVANNGAWQIEVYDQANTYGRVVGTRLQFADYAAMARAFAGKHYAVYGLARSGLATVEALLVNADAEVNAAVGSFFRAPAGGGDPVAMIKPMGSIKVTMRVGAQASSLAPIAVKGRRLLVPVVAVNAHYRGSGAMLTESVSFIIGRGDAEAEKLAPFRLDLGARRWSGLAARPHSSGLTPA